MRSPTAAPYHERARPGTPTGRESRLKIDQVRVRIPLRALIDHVNNLKLQYLVELSKLGDSCAGLETGIEAWLNEHDVVFAGSTIPFVLMPHFISPGQLRARQARGAPPLEGARPLLRRLPARRRAARRARGLPGGGLADPDRARLPAPDAHLPPRRVPHRLRRQVPRVQRRLAGRHRLHGHPLRGPHHGDRPAARPAGVRHRLHADAARADRHAARRLRARPRPPQGPARAPAAGARRRRGRARRAGVPDHLRGRPRGRAGGAARHARRAHATTARR